jgi:hypothetical protein
MADRDGVFIYVGIYSSETDARLDHEAVKVLRECEVGYYDAAAVTGFALHTAAAIVADLSSTKHRQREFATRFGSEVAAEICEAPFVWRYSTDEGVVGLAGSEGAFLICSFWLVSALALAGRVEAAERNLEQPMGLQNDAGLLSEEHDPANQRAGQFPSGVLTHRNVALHLRDLGRAQAGAAMNATAKASSIGRQAT